jgi:hypothetical protein
LAGHLAGLEAGKAFRDDGVEPEAGPTRLAASGQTPVRTKLRVRVGVQGSPAPEKKVTGLRGMAGGDGGPAEVVIWAGRGGEASGNAPAAGGG